MNKKASKKKHILIAAGGSGGHIYPALAVANYIFKNYDNVTISWFGSKFGMEENIVKKNPNIKYYSLPIKRLRGNGFLRWGVMPIALTLNVLRSLFLILRIQPDCVLCMGGFVSAPTGIASKIAMKKLVIHEQNAISGYANRLLAVFANKIFTAFPKSVSVGNDKKKQLVGNPVIDKIKQIGNTKNILCSEGCIKIAVLGGSQGSSSLNNNLPEILTEISEHTSKIDLWHQSGKGHGESTRKNYDKSKFNSIKVQEYIEDIYEVYSWADLIICRSGAMTVSEIIAVGLPAIMVPYPFAVDNHQYLNAVFLKNSNAGFIVKQGRGFMDDMFLQLKYLLKGDVKTAKTRLQEISDKISALREGLQDADKTIASFCMKDK